MNIVIPIAGRASRFKEAGFEKPKPLIEIRGKPMVKWATDSLPFAKASQFIFICLREHEENFDITAKLQNIYSNKIRVLYSDGITEGSTYTVLLAGELINNDNELVVYNADQYFGCKNLGEELNNTKKKKWGLIPVFEATHPRWSFAKINNKGFITKVAEKVPISNNATVGFYYFAKGKDFVWAAEEMIQKDIRRNNEFYVCPAYNELIARGDKIKALEVDFMWGLGTPEHVAYFEKYFKEDSAGIKGGEIML